MFWSTDLSGRSGIPLEIFIRSKSLITLKFLNNIFSSSYDNSLFSKSENSNTQMHITSLCRMIYSNSCAYARIQTFLYDRINTESRPKRATEQNEVKQILKSCVMCGYLLLFSAAVSHGYQCLHFWLNLHKGKIITATGSASKLCWSLSPRHGASSVCRWRTASKYQWQLRIY
jgi:hypothetical protein